MSSPATLRSLEESGALAVSPACQQHQKRRRRIQTAIPTARPTGEAARPPTPPNPPLPNPTTPAIPVSPTPPSELPPAPQPSRSPQKAHQAVLPPWPNSPTHPKILPPSQNPQKCLQSLSRPGPGFHIQRPSRAGRGPPRRSQAEPHRWRASAGEASGVRRMLGTGPEDSQMRRDSIK